MVTSEGDRMTEEFCGIHTKILRLLFTSFFSNLTDSFGDGTKYKLL